MKAYFRELLAILAVTIVAAPASLGLRFPAPEIDPAMGVAPLMLLGGVILILRGRSKK